MTHLKEKHHNEQFELLLKSYMLNGINSNKSLTTAALAAQIWKITKIELLEKKL